MNIKKLIDMNQSLPFYKLMFAKNKKSHLEFFYSLSPLIFPKLQLCNVFQDISFMHELL